MFNLSQVTLPGPANLHENQLVTSCSAVAPLEERHGKRARARLDAQAKPVGSLGKLEMLAERLAGIQEGAFPLRASPAVMFTVAADHGVVEEGVAAVPQEITARMVGHFLAGGAGINALCRHGGVDLVIIDAGVKAALPESALLLSHKIAWGTANFTKGPAMTEAECLHALCLGLCLGRSAREQGFHVLGLGEMGIGNTTPSTALCCAFLGFSPDEITGAGAGIPHKGLAHKGAVIAAALEMHREQIRAGRPLPMLAALGGLEIATLAGLILGGAENRLAVMVDGFIATAAYVVARALCPKVEEYCFFSHVSAESGHAKVLEALGREALLDLGLRLGEGTGAALGVGVLGAAVAVYNEMAELEV